MMDDPSSDNHPTEKVSGALKGTKLNKPSDDNQRHSNKVEEIDVLINPDFISGTMRAQEAEDDQMRGPGDHIPVDFVANLNEVGGLAMQEAHFSGIPGSRMEELDEYDQFVSVDRYPLHH
jgi:hypothetical protein